MASNDNLFPDTAAAAQDGGEPTTEAPTTPEAGPAPAKKAAKKAAKRAPRKTAKKAAAAPEAGVTEPTAPELAASEPAISEPATSEAAAEPGVEPGAEDAAAPKEKPAKKAAKRAPRKTAKKAAATAPEPTDAETDVPVTEAPAAPEPAEVEAVVVPAEEVAEEEAVEETPAVPSFGLLFQPPDPALVTRRRSRRATAPEATPAHAEAAPAEPTEAAEAGTGPVAEQDHEQDQEAGEGGGRRRRRRGGKGRGRGRGGEAAEQADTPESAEQEETAEAAGQTGPEAEQAEEAGESTTSRRRRRRRRTGGGAAEGEDEPGTVTKVREPRKERDEVTSLKGSTRLEAKKQRRREGREAGRRRTVITEAEFLARRESVERVMVVRHKDDRTQIGVLEDGVLVEHYVSRETSNASMAGNVYLGRVQNVLPSMEAAFVDIGKGRNAVLYAGEVNWDAAGLENNKAKRIENALSSGDSVLVQVTKDPIGHKGARLTSQISLPGRYLVYVPDGNMTGISRKLPDTERARLKKILREVVPDNAGVIVRTAAEGASEDELRADVARLTAAWEDIQAKAKARSNNAPALLHGEPDLTVRVIRDVFNEDFTSLVVSGDSAWGTVSDYIHSVAPDLAGRLTKWTSETDVFAHHRVEEQLAKAMDRKVWLPSGGSLVIDRTEAMTVIDVNTGKFVGSGGNLEETVTKNNIEAAEEIVRQLRLRDVGGIIVIDFIDMVLESNRELVVRRLLECLGRDRTKHQVAEVTSLGLVQMTRKRVGTGLIEVFSEQCEHCNGRGIIVHAEPVEKSSGNGGNGGNGGNNQGAGDGSQGGSGRSRSRRGKGSGRDTSGSSAQGQQDKPAEKAAEKPAPSGPTPAQIAAAAHAAALHASHAGEEAEAVAAEAAKAVEAVAAGDVTDVPAEAPKAAEPEQAVEAEKAAEPTPAQAPEPAAQEPAAEPVPATQPVVAAEPATAPATRGRRKRARVVAPAGPPRAATAGEASREFAEQGAQQVP
ncbi:Rne/Rng family ribonuclease [Oryzihumus leptocrescens]|uniref:Ribonuclease E n=1 Tax=Oryzihumus leptocrescens TaxID=297536 RepID=A0A542ZKY9_9MICO|nr:Rne/Rng family ribonuclease [Oryzihumus leptocrescens]TQL61022.1 ribonuclease E [Oryzihumus leptocrescens]